MPATLGTFTTRSPWTDRWTRPEVEQLLDSLDEQHRPGFKQLIEQAESFGQVEQSISWYGASWRWTIQYRLYDDGRDDQGDLCYLVPREAAPLVCVPLHDSVLSALPARRLGRYINDGIRSAKCAVAMHWAVWTPNTPNEVNFLADLLKRKVKIIRKIPESTAS